MFSTKTFLFLYDKCTSRHLSKHFHELLRNTGAGAEEIARYQSSALRSILEYARAHCPYYKEILGKIDVQEAGNEMKHFDRIPILYKETIRDNFRQLLSSQYAGTNNICFDHTGGSSGEPLEFAYDKEYKDFRWATIYFNLFLTGFRFGDCHGFIYGSNYDRRRQYSVRQRLQSMVMNAFTINAFFLNDRDLGRFMSKIIRKKPKFLIGYASSLVHAAQYVKEHNLKINVSFIESTSEYLSAENRRVIEDAFHCQVYDRYGCREVGNIAHECRSKNGGHINWQSVYVEIVNKGAYPALGPDYGDIVITSLMNKGMPFIRYYIGDIGRIVETPCDCGLHSPRLELAGTRVGDLLMAWDGSLVSSPALTLMYKDIEGIRKIQFVQERPGEVSINVVRDEGFSDIQSVIAGRAEKIFGQNMDIRINFVGSIEKEPSGKYRMAKRLFPLHENTTGE